MQVEEAEGEGSRRWRRAGVSVSVATVAAVAVAAVVATVAVGGTPTCDGEGERAGGYPRLSLRHERRLANGPTWPRCSTALGSLQPGLGQPRCLVAPAAW